jgi:hypothetical protein
LLRRHPARRETAAQAADFPEAAFRAHGRPRHLPILALASVAIRPLASGQRRSPAANRSKRSTAHTLNGPGGRNAVRGVSLEELDVLGVDRPSLLGRYPGASEWTFHAAHTTGRRSLALGRPARPASAEAVGAFHDSATLNPRQTASLCCIRDQPRQFRTLLRDFRRPCPCCTHRLHPPIEPPLGPTHQFRCSKKLLPRHHFHDPPPDGSIRRLG